MNGGIYRNNALTAETGTMSIGTVLLATNGCKVTVTGGEFYGNTCASAENGNGFACSGTNAAAHAAAAQFHEEHPDSKMEIFIVDSHAYSMAEARA